MLRAHGFSLLEFLAALVIFSVGILGSLAWQVRALNLTESAYYTDQSLIILQGASVIPYEDSEFQAMWQQQINLPQGRSKLDHHQARVMWQERHHGDQEVQFIPVWE
ncbi:MAG: prepilin-type N-terminal cleavage/methylation domain-containing protein [Legionellales bacterium]|nr:prepilin-type N-terminal cleavage/methylation domain-containing protein [Legionellales bacterium]